MSKELDAIAAMVIFAADNAVLDGQRDGTIRVSADRTRLAVNAALECAVNNGLLTIAPDWKQRMEQGVTLRFAPSEAGS